MSAALMLMIGLALFFALRGILTRNRFFEFPTLVSLLYLAFFVPQALAAERNPLLQAYQPWVLWFYMSCALITLAVGFAIGRHLARKRASGKRPAEQPSFLVVSGAIVLALIGLYASNQVSSLADAANALGNSWTGEITAWYLLVQCTFFAFALSFLGFLSGERNKILFLVAIISAYSIASMLDANVKRNLIAEIAIILGGGWFFVKYQQPPRALILIGCFAAMVLLHQVGAVRGYIADERGTAIDAIIEGVPFKEFRYFSSDQSPEIQQAIVDIYAARQSGQVEGPASLWNQVVHQYVPAFLLGRDFKNSLMVERRTAGQENYRLDAFERTGATRTGFSDTYRSYSILGVFVFMLMGMLMGWLFGMAVYGRLWAQYYYLLLLNDGLMAFTESTDRFFATALFVVAATIFFVLPRKNASRSFWAKKYSLRPFRPANRHNLRGPA